MASYPDFGDLNGSSSSIVLPSIEQFNGYTSGEDDDHVQLQVQSDIMNDSTRQHDAQQNGAVKKSRTGKSKSKGKKKEKQNVAFANGGPSEEGPGSHRVNEARDLETEKTTHKTQGRGKPRSIVRIGEPEEENGDVNLNGDDDDENDDTEIDSEPGKQVALIKQEEPIKTPGRGRGRPSKNSAINSNLKAVGGSSAKKRKRVELETGPSQRPTRAAAESARSGMAEQSASKRSKPSAATTPATKSKAKAKTNGASAPVTRRGRKPDTSNHEYAVEKIVDSRLNKKKGAIEYFVKWQNYAASENTWEPADNLEHCSKKLAQYTKSQKSK